MMPKQLIKLAVILILLSSSLYAQIDSTKANQGVNINFFNGYAVSYKWNVNQDMNSRVYLSLSSSWTDNQTDAQNKDNEIETWKNEETQNNKYVSANLSYQFLFDLFSRKTFNFYVGIGPIINYAYNTFETKETNVNEDNNSSRKSNNKYESYGIGIISLLGIEAHLTNTITLFAETHLDGVKTWSTSNGKHEYISSYNYNNEEISEYTQDGSGWSANLQLVKVGLGIYF